MSLLHFPPQRVVEINSYILRTGLAVCLEYLSLNDYDITTDEETLADATVDLITGALPETEFADILYGLWQVEQKD